MSAGLRRVGVAALAFGAVAVGTLAVVAPPERCPAVSVAELRSSANETVEWFVRNQRPDGTWLYEYDRGTARATPDYNVVRHSGAVMGLYQATSAGVAGALEAADRGLAWSTERLVERDEWTAISYRGQTSVGAVALLAAGLAERRLHTGDTRHDDLLRRLGRFLVAQTEESGAVLAYYDSETRAPLPREYSKYYTGEAFWALGRLHTLFPAGGWGETADRVGTYMATRRDDVEDYWPPLPDHWAAYGLAEAVTFAERAGGRPLTDGELGYARRQAGLFGAQVRWVSQQAGPWGEFVRGTSVLRGGGYGVVGEALTGLWQVAHADDRLTDIRAPIAERATCMAALALRAQSGATEADEFGEPERVRGAWFRDGVTRMDDQQHALSAVLRTIPIVEARQVAGGSDGRQVPATWLWLVALLAAINPCRAAFGVPQRDRAPRAAAGLAAFGGLVGGVAVLLISFGGSRLLDAIAVSDPAMRIAAGVVAGVAGIVAFVRRPPSAEPALPGWRAALVPVAVPLVASPALTVLAISAYADRGPALLSTALAVGVGALTAMAAGARPGGVTGRVLRWAAHLTATLLVVAGALLVIDGIFTV